MKVLGIETSCDETAISVVEFVNNRIAVLSNIVSSQVKLHAQYGGVVPNLAAREHVKNIERVFNLALHPARSLAHAKIASPQDLGETTSNEKGGIRNIDLIAVTRGPGLGPALLVGIAFAKTLAWKYQKPLVGVNHLEGHIYSNRLKPVGAFSILNFKFSKKIFPLLNLIVSGGHTELVLMNDRGEYKLIGETLDDAAGEAFDKIARLLGLGYPGGPAISHHAEKWKSQITNYKSQTNSKTQIIKIEFPKPMEKSKDYNFSYSGLKTSVLYKIRDLENAGIKITDKIKNEICYKFQKAACDILIQKTIRAAHEYKVKSVFLSGGVSANRYLRTNLKKQVKENNLGYSQPTLEYTGDNAAMIALAGYMNYTKNPPLLRNVADQWKSIDMDANLGL